MGPLFRGGRPDMDQFITTLKVLSHRTRNVLVLLDISPAETQTLAENIAQVKMMLVRLKDAGIRQCQNVQLTESIDDLILNYLELEEMAAKQKKRLNRCEHISMNVLECPCKLVQMKHKEAGKGDR